MLGDGFECGRTPVIQLALDPVALFLFGANFCGQSPATSKSSPRPKQLDHVECVITLFRLEPKPRPDSGQKGLGRSAGRCSPVPAGTGKTWVWRSRNNPAVPIRLHPVQDPAITVGDDDLHAVLVKASRRRKGSDYGDTTFAIDEAGGVSPVSVERLGQAERSRIGWASRPRRKSSNGSAADSKSARSSSRSAPAWPRPAIASSAERSDCST